MLTVSTARFVAGGECLSTWEAIRDLLWKSKTEDDLLAVEGVGLAHRIEAAHALIETSEVVGVFKGLAGAMWQKTTIVSIPAVEWRKTLTGRNNAPDRLVKEVVSARVQELPVRFNVHIADALGLALVAGWRRLNRVG